MKFLQRNVIVITLFLLTLLIYAGARDAELLHNWDDNHYVTTNPMFQPTIGIYTFQEIWTRPYFASYIPVTISSYALEYALWQDNPVVYHVNNVLLHALNGVLVYLFISRLLSNQFAAFITTVLFLIHPVQVEVVAWVSQRKTLLSMAFFLITWLLHIRSTESPERRWMIMMAWITFALSLLSKTTPVGAPLLFLLFDVEWKKQHPLSAIMRFTPYMITSVLAAVMQVYAHSIVGAIKPPFVETVIGRVVLELQVIWDYLVSLLYPLNLNNLVVYNAQTLTQRPVTIFLGGIIVIILVYLLISRWRLARFAALWMIVLMLPVANIIPLAIQRADRYLYFPSVMLFALVGAASLKAWNTFKADHSRYIMAGILGGVMLTGTTLTVMRVEVWTSSATLWRDHRQHYPLSNTGLLNEGIYYYHIGDYAQASYLLETLVTHYPNDWKGYRGLGHIAYAQRDYVQAANRYQQYMLHTTEQVDPVVVSRFGDALMRIGLDFHFAEDYETADMYYQWALSYLPENAQLQNNIGYNYYLMDKYEASLAALQQAIRFDPDYLLAYQNLEIVANETGDITLLEKAHININRLNICN